MALRIGLLRSTAHEQIQNPDVYKNIKSQPDFSHVDGIFIEESADTYHDHMYRGQDKYKNAPKLHQNAPPEG